MDSENNMIIASNNCIKLKHTDITKLLYSSFVMLVSVAV